MAHINVLLGQTGQRRSFNAKPGSGGSRTSFLDKECRFVLFTRGFSLWHRGGRQLVWRVAGLFFGCAMKITSVCLDSTSHCNMRRILLQSLFNSAEWHDWTRPDLKRWRDFTGKAEGQTCKSDVVSASTRGLGSMVHYTKYQNAHLDIFFSMFNCCGRVLKSVLLLARQRGRLWHWQTAVWWRLWSCSSRPVLQRKVAVKKTTLTAPLLMNFQNLFVYVPCVLMLFCLNWGIWRLAQIRRIMDKGSWTCTCIKLGEAKFSIGLIASRVWKRRHVIHKKGQWTKMQMLAKHPNFEHFGEDQKCLHGLTFS